MDLDENFARSWDILGNVAKGERSKGCLDKEGLLQFGWGVSSHLRVDLDSQGMMANSQVVFISTAPSSALITNTLVPQWRSPLALKSWKLDDW